MKRVFQSSPAVLTVALQDRMMRMTSRWKWILGICALVLISIELVELCWFPSTRTTTTQQPNRTTTIHETVALDDAIVSTKTNHHPNHPTRNKPSSSWNNDKDKQNDKDKDGSLFLGVEPRAYPPWKNATSLPLPCLEWPPRRRHGNGGLQPPLQRGFLLLKPMKVGGSTAAGIHLRYTHRLAARLGIGGRSRTTMTKSVGLDHHRAYNCRGRWDHGQASQVHAQRDKSQSFLWTLVRHPTNRAVSEFFHFQVSKKKVPPTFQNFVKYLTKQKPHMKDFYPQFLTINATLLRTLRKNHNSVEAARDVLYQIGWKDYDFIGVTERMEETAVAFMMLLNGTIADILFLNAKNQGSYDAMCYKVQPTNLTADMKAFLSSPTWQAQIQWDEIIFEWANASLDRTIQALNATEFAANLKAFRDAQDVVRQECGSFDVFPCSQAGKRNNPNSDCLWRDSGCAFTCINQVAQKLGLDPHPILRPEEYLVDASDDEDDDDYDDDDYDDDEEEDER